MLLILFTIESDDWPCSSKCPWPFDKLINCRKIYELKVRGSNKKELKINNRSHSLTLCFNRWFSSISWCSCKLANKKENWITESTDHENRLIVQNNMVTMHISSCTSYGASCTVIFTNFAWIFYFFSLLKVVKWPWTWEHRPPLEFFLPETHWSSWNMCVRYWTKSSAYIYRTELSTRIKTRQECCMNYLCFYDTTQAFFN